MGHQGAAATLTDSLGLGSKPIALKFADADAGRDIAIQARAAPSSCSFWRSAEEGVFYAPAGAHFGCPVGAMVMGFDLPKAVSDELGELVGVMGARGYLSPDEPPHIPTNQAGAEGIIYGPLAEFPVPPDVVVCWLTPSQAMIWNEAAGGAAWTAGTGGSVSGRPACAALPNSIKERRPMMSLGCIGMRTFTEISGDLLLGVVPGSELEAFSDALAAMRRTNDGMAAFYQSRKDSFAAQA
jgi:uncharacterized protein (DUF169 family)